jgi:hypothetical protein
VRLGLRLGSECIITGGQRVCMFSACVYSECVCVHLKGRKCVYGVCEVYGVCVRVCTVCV